MCFSCLHLKGTETQCQLACGEIKMLTLTSGWVQADVPTPPAEEESQFQQITAARKYIAEQALKQQVKKVSCQADLLFGSNQCVHPVC